MIAIQPKKPASESRVPRRGPLLLLTSYERDHPENDLQVGSFLWTLSHHQLQTQQAPTIVRTVNGQVLHFAHKGEAVTPMKNGRVLVVHDDDRRTGRPNITNPVMQFRRQINEGPFEIIQLSR